MSSFGSRLKECRKEKGSSQAYVCKRVGMSQANLSDLERNVYPSSSFVPLLAEVYGVSALWLAEGKGEKSINANGLPGIVNPQPVQAIRNLQEESITLLAGMDQDDAQLWLDTIRAASSKARRKQQQENDKLTNVI